MAMLDCVHKEQIFSSGNINLEVFMMSLKRAGKKAAGLLVAGAVVATAIFNGGTPKASANADSATVQGKNINSFCVEGAGTGQEFDANNWTFKTLLDKNISEKYKTEQFQTGIVSNIHSQDKESVIRLINGMEYEDMSNVGTDARSGYAMLDKKVKLDNDSRFSAKFTFSMPEATCYTGYDKGAGGDGIVFVITTDEELNGLSGGAIGYKGITNSLGIELDSFYNTGNGQGYYDPKYDQQYKDYRKDHVAVVLDGENTTVDKHIATSFLYESGYLEGFTQEGSLTTYGEEADTRLFTVWVEYDGEDLYVSYAKGDFVSAVRPAEAQIVVDGSEDDRVKTKLNTFAGQEVKVGFTSAIGSSKANHTIHSVALVNEYIEAGIQTTYMEKYYVENANAADDTKDLVVVNGKKYVLVKTNLVIDGVTGANVTVTDLQDVYAKGYSVVDYTDYGYPSIATVAADGSTVVNQFFNHEHIWEYENEGKDKIVAECEDDNCEINDQEISITIKAEDEYYTGNPYRSAEFEDLLTDVTGDEVPVIYYEGVLEDGTEYEKTTVPPTEVGSYIASVTVGDVTAEDSFLIVELKIVAEDEYYTGNPYSSDEVEMPLETDDELVVYYEGIGETEYEKTTVPPTEVGTYKATAVLGDATAEDDFAILPVEDTDEEDDEVVEVPETTPSEEEDVVVEVPETTPSEEDVVVEVPETTPIVEEDAVEEETEVTTEETTEVTTEETTEATVVEDDEEDVAVEVPEAAPSVDDAADVEEETEATAEEEEEEDIDIEVPEAAPGVDADANTGDSSNFMVLFVVMLVSALGLLAVGKKKVSFSK